jgi:lysophospholipase L1-like esterase
VHVKLPDGTEMTRDKDYLLDPKWAGFSRIEGGRIGKDGAVTVEYRIGRMRIDAIEVNKNGVVHLHRGEEKMTRPNPPQADGDCVAIANVFMPYHVASVEPWQVFRITAPTFPEPKVGTSLVAKTLAKLRAGEPVTIVTWGDSVTANGDASSADKAFAQLFPARLRERFPTSKITAHNAGIGATNSEQRLPALKAQVLDFHPDLVTIEFVNDMGHPEAAMRDRYAKIFEQIRDAGAEIILITPHFTMPEMMNKPQPRGGETRATVALLRDIAAKHKVALADTSKRWEHLDAEGLPYTTLLTNGINHPDDRGHEMFTRDLLAYFPQ